MATRQDRGRQASGQPAAPLVIDLYARISRSTDKTRGRSVEGQVEDGIADITERGATVGKVWRDESKSAWNPKVIRPEWDELMTRLENGECDGVWVWELTRFTRKMVEGERLLDLAKRGVVVWSDDQTHNLNKAAGRRAFRDAMVAAVAESETISERTARGKRRKAMRGKSNATHRGFATPGSLPTPEDWEPGDPRIPVPDEQVEREREAVREVTRRLLAGDTLASVVRWLNEQGHRTYAGREWSTDGVRAMLRRPALAGIAEYHGEEVGTLPGEHALDRETWQRLQSVMDSRRVGRKPSEKYLLTYLLTCGRCGHRLTGRPRIGRKPYEDGEVAREYWCQKRAGHGSGCGRLAIDQRFADEVVETAVIEKLGDPRHADRLARRAARAQAERDEITSEVTRLEADAEALAGKVAAWGMARVDAAMRPIDTRLRTLRERLEAIDAPEGPTVAAADAADDWERGNIDQKRAMVRRAFPEGITVLPTEARGRLARDRKRFRWDAER